PISPGPYVMTAFARMEQNRTALLSTRSVLLQLGDNSVGLELPELFRFEVAVPEIGSIETLALDSSADTIDGPRVHIERFNLDPSRLVAFDAIPAGDYVLVRRRGRVPLDEMVVSVPTSGPVTFSGRPISALRVEITDSSGELARAGFTDGD